METIGLNVQREELEQQLRLVEMELLQMEKELQAWQANTLLPSDHWQGEAADAHREALSDIAGRTQGTIALLKARHAELMHRVGVMEGVDVADAVSEKGAPGTPTGSEVAPGEQGAPATGSEVAMGTQGAPAPGSEAGAQGTSAEGSDPSGAKPKRLPDDVI